MTISGCVNPWKKKKYLSRVRLNHFDVVLQIEQYPYLIYVASYVSLSFSLKPSKIIEL